MSVQPGGSIEQMLSSLKSSLFLSSSSVSFQSASGRHASTFCEKGWKGTSYWINYQSSNKSVRSCHSLCHLRV